MKQIVENIKHYCSISIKQAEQLLEENIDNLSKEEILELINHIDDTLDTKDLSELYQKDFETFIFYNISDTTLVGELEKKLGYISLAISIMYKTKCSPDSIFGTVQPWDCLIYNELLKYKMLCPPAKHHTMIPFPGGFVRQPEVGMFDLVIVKDIISSYPNQIRSFNISPETLLADRDTPEELKQVARELGYRKDQSDTDLDVCPTEHIEAIEKYSHLFKKYNVCFTANGHYFRKDVEGIIPNIYSRLFNERLDYKKIGKQKKKEYNETKDPQVKYEMEQAELYSYTLKILLNSGYGALANVHSRYFDIRMAAAITCNGQTCCRGVSNYLNKSFSDIKHIYNDTDSVFYSLEGLVKKRYPNGLPDKDKLLEFILKLDKVVLEPKVNEFFERLKEAMNMRELTIAMETECIAETSLHLAKKRYIMTKIWDEGVYHLDKPKLKIRGVEIVRTSTPQIVRDKLKEAVNLIFETKSNEVLIDFVSNYKKEFFKASFEDIAFPRSVTFGNYTLNTPGLPIGVRAAFIYNHFLKSKKLDGKYPLIANGNKIKFCFIKEPNRLKSNVVGVPNKAPEELLDYIEIDYEMQFIKTFLAPLENIFKAINWSYEKKANLLDFF